MMPPIPMRHNTPCSYSRTPPPGEKVRELPPARGGGASPTGTGCTRTLVVLVALLAVVLTGVVVRIVLVGVVGDIVIERPDAVGGGGDTSIARTSVVGAMVLVCVLEGTEEGLG